MAHESEVKRCIYRITCVANGKVYIGSTHNVASRWRAHRYELNRGTHHNQILRRAWNAHGQQNFKFEIVEDAGHLDEPAMLEREKYWIEASNSWAPNGFNVADPVEFAYQAARDFVLTSPEGVEHHVHNLYKWCRENGFGKSGSACFSSTAIGRKASHKGWLCWPMGDTREQWQARVDVFKKAHEDDKARRRGIRPTQRRLTKSYIVTSPDGREKLINNMAKFARENSMHASPMLRVANGRGVSYRGWKCRHVDENIDEATAREQLLLSKMKHSYHRTIIVTAPQGTVHTIRPWAMSAWCIERGLTRRGLLSALDNKSKMYNGYHVGILNERRVA